MSSDSFHRMLDKVINSSDSTEQAGWFARLGRSLGLYAELVDCGRDALEAAGFGGVDDFIFVEFGGGGWARDPKTGKPVFVDYDD